MHSLSKPVCDLYVALKIRRESAIESRSYVSGTVYIRRACHSVGSTIYCCAARVWPLGNCTALRKHASYPAQLFRAAGRHSVIAIIYVGNVSLISAIHRKDEGCRTGVRPSLSARFFQNEKVADDRT